MNLNQLAAQLKSLLAAASAMPITVDLDENLELAGASPSLDNVFLEILVEEICAYGEIDSLSVWTQAEPDESGSSRVMIGLKVCSKQVGVPVPKRLAMQELADRLNDSGCMLRMWVEDAHCAHYEILFSTGEKSDHALRDMGGCETILLVEDDDVVRSVTAQVLENCGYSVLPAGDAKSAAEIFARNRDRIAVLLTDLRLMDENGAELAEKLAKSDPGLKVILMSGYMETEVIGREFGDVDMAFLAKPFSADALLNKVRQAFQSPQAGENSVPRQDAALWELQR